MTRFVVHVGPHKTGSTYLQEAFALLRPHLAEHGIHYPLLWGDKAHHDLYDALRTDPNPALEAQFADLRAAGHETVLLSSEVLSVSPKASIAHLRRLVGPDTPVRIVSYVRAWAGLLPSQWKQNVKSGHTLTLPEFLFKQLINPAASRVNFGTALHVMADAFGKDAIRLVAYDQVVAAKQDLFSHFADAFLGLPDQPAPALPPANVSPSTADIEVIRALAAWQCARRNDPVAHPVADATVAHYLQYKPVLEMPALTRALAAHQSTLTINEGGATLMELHRQLFDAFGPCLVPPRLPKCFFRPRVAEVPFVRPDYLLAADVQRELGALHQVIRGGRVVARRAARVAAAPPSDAAPPGPAMVLHLLAHPSMAAAGQAAVVPVAAPVHVVSFAADGNSDTCIGEGWSRAEPTGRWSSAQSCDLQLPRPAAPGDYVLTIQARPFAAPGQAPSQRLAVEANDAACGEVTLATPAVIRATLPWDVVGRAETLLLRFRFPDAVRPADVVPGARDRRLLGAAFRLLSLAGPLPVAAMRPAAPVPVADPAD